MGRLISIVIGLYVFVALAAAGGAVFGLATHAPTRDYDCADMQLAIATGGAPKGTQGEPNRLKEIAIHAAAWPWSLWQAAAAKVSTLDWFILRYDYAPGACRWGAGGPMTYPSSVKA